MCINPLNAELNPICHLLALLGGATIVVVSRLRVKVGTWNKSTFVRVLQIRCVHITRYFVNENLKQPSKHYKFFRKNVTTNLLRTLFATQHTIIYKTPHFRSYFLQQNKLTERLNRHQYNTQWTFRAVFYDGVGKYNICKKKKSALCHSHWHNNTASLEMCLYNEVEKKKRNSFVTKETKHLCVHTEGKTNARVSKFCLPKNAPFTKHMKC